MSPIYAVVVVGFLAVPTGLVAVLTLIHTLRERHPDVLKEVDPAGFRTFYLPSQLKFLAFVARGGLRSLHDRRINVCLSISLVCCVLVFMYLFVTTFVRIE